MSQSGSPAECVVSNDYEKQITSILESIDRISIRQDEIKGYIVTLDQGVMTLDKRMRTADMSQQLKLTIAIQKSTELIAKLYDSISSFESIRQRYQQDISKLTGEKLKFVHLELRRIDEKFNVASSDVTTVITELRTMLQELGRHSEVKESLDAQMSDSPEYSMK